jgi:hypothetical protein
VTVTGGGRTEPHPEWIPPAELPAPERPRWVAPVATGAALALGCAAVALWDPGDGGTAVCWSKSVFGVDCPLCGGLRATNALLRGDWLAAADHNVLVAIALPVVVVLWAVWLVRSLQDRPFRLPAVPRPVLVAVGVALLAFAVVRNLDVDVGWVHWLASDTA